MNDLALTEVLKSACARAVISLEARQSLDIAGDRSKFFRLPLAFMPMKRNLKVSQVRMTSKNKTSVAADV